LAAVAVVIVGDHIKAAQISCRHTDKQESVGVRELNTKKRTAKGTKKLKARGAWRQWKAEGSDPDQFQAT